MNVLDTGAPRRLHDVFAINGDKYSNLRAPALNSLNLTVFGRNKLRHAEALEFSNLYDDAFDKMVELGLFSSWKEELTKGRSGQILAILATFGDKPEVIRFIDRMIKGEGVVPGSPEQYAIKRIKSVDGGGRRARVAVVNWMLDAFAKSTGLAKNKDDVQFKMQTWHNNQIQKAV